MNLTRSGATTRFTNWLFNPQNKLSLSEFTDQNGLTKSQLSQLRIVSLKRIRAMNSEQLAEVPKQIISEFYEFADNDQFIYMRSALNRGQSVSRLTKLNLVRSVVVEYSSTNNIEQLKSLVLNRSKNLGLREWTDASLEGMIKLSLRDYREGILKALYLE